MINEQVMADTVQRMLEAGIDEPTVLSTLVDTGLTQEEAASIIQKVKAPKAPVQEEIIQQQQDVQMLRNVVETQAQEQDLQQTQTHNMLNMHEQKIDDVSKKVDEVKQVIKDQASPADPSLNYRISNLENKMEEINAGSKAMLDLMQKILETDRKVLTELESKK
ncbi:MAG: hypothetical protein WCW44_02070 [archaeon]|jgi:hypothetical protein